MTALVVSAFVVRTATPLSEGNLKYPPFWRSPLCYKALPSQFQPPKLRTGRPPTEVQNPQPPKSARESAQRGAGRKRGARGSGWESGKCLGKCSSSLFLEETQGASTFPSTSPSTPFLAGTSPSTFGGLGVLHFCTGPHLSQLQNANRHPPK